MLLIEELVVNRGQGEQTFQVSLPYLALNAGEIIALKGISGCGKSTLLELIGLILTPNQLTRYQLDGVEISPSILAEHQSVLANLRAQYFGFMPQTGGLLPFLNVQQNIELSSQILNKKLDSQWIRNIIEQLSISHLLDKFPKQLSIGERQRVSFVRAIAHKPMVLLADEPTASLDPKNATTLFEMMLQLVKELNISAIVVSHDWQSLQQFAIPFFAPQLENPQQARFLPQEMGR
ncbi:ABC transporter ATP-binding protein [Pasteurellaceae bacterium Macca]|nr:ABC transporter ATP-binding protein [Pasteurellaceae bacterium Macca]